jgi:non-specific serine/threonine protein kinase
LSGKFEFAYKEGKPFLRVLDTSIKRIIAIPSNKPRPVEVETVELSPEGNESDQVLGPSQRIGVVFNFNYPTYPGFQVEAVQGESDEEQKNFLGKVEKLDLSKFVNIEILSEDDKNLVPALRRCRNRK